MLRLVHRFNLPVLQSMMSSSRSTRLIQSLHTILRPFLLRRLKTDVETSLPPKKEYVLYAPLSERQRELYDAIVNGGLRALLVKEGGTSKGKNARSNDEEEDVPVSLQAQHRSSDGKMKTRAQLRQSTRKSYDVDGDDDEYFERLESGEVVAEHHKTKKQSAEEMGRDWQRENLRKLPGTIQFRQVELTFNSHPLVKKVSNMRLQNTVMQLRKVCSHPFLFDWPTDAKTREPILNEELVTASGKMLVLDRLLDALFATKHRVLLFSQFTTMLDIIEVYRLLSESTAAHWAPPFSCRIGLESSKVGRYAVSTALLPWLNAERRSTVSRTATMSWMHHNCSC